MNGIQTVVCEELKNLFDPSDLGYLQYWLANSYAVALTEPNEEIKIEVGFGYMYAYFGDDYFFVAGNRVFDSKGNKVDIAKPILAVVVLDPNVTFEKGENNTWNLKK